jgi:hypothetical protein
MIVLGVYGIYIKGRKVGKKSKKLQKAYVPPILCDISRRQPFIDTPDSMTASNSLQKLKVIIHLAAPTIRDPSLLYISDIAADNRLEKKVLQQISLRFLPHLEPK